TQNNLHLGGYMQSSVYSNCKANRRLERWSKNKNQINHIIISAFLECENENGISKLYDMKKLCSNKDSMLYVKNFDANFNSMKTDSGNSHGKFFETDNNHNVWVWHQVKPKFEILKPKFRCNN
ncbi:MAG TPA: hypothetical protein H9991_03740, partial [Candidatus Mailhella excrementigallinarum]|nr:hypothetical protein [Candidatus Mailhella excrementigallinarum]